MQAIYVTGIRVEEPLSLRPGFFDISAANFADEPTIHGSRVLTEDVPEPVPVVVKILLQKRDNLLSETLIKARLILHADEIRVSNLVVAIVA